MLKHTPGVLQFWIRYLKGSQRNPDQSFLKLESLNDINNINNH